MSKKRIKRASAIAREYKEGSQAAIGATAREDYNKINFRNAAVNRFNDMTDRKNSTAGRRRSSAPFSNISGLGGFGNRPQLGFKRNEK